MAPWQSTILLFGKFLNKHKLWLVQNAECRNRRLEVTKLEGPIPNIPSHFSSRLRIYLEIANLGTADVGHADRSRPSIPWTAVTALTSRIYKVFVVVYLRNQLF